MKTNKSKTILFILLILSPLFWREAGGQAKAQTIISTSAGVDSGGPGYDNGYTGNGGAATLAKMNNTAGVAVDRIGNIFIADQTNQVIRKVNTAGIITTAVGNGYGAGTGSGGYNKPSGLATFVELDAPSGVAVDTAGNVYFCDVGNNVVRKLLSTGYVITIAGNATGAGAGTGGYSGDGGAATLAEISSPNNVAVDISGSVYISDWGNNVIRKVNAAGIISTIAGNNAAGLGYSGDGGQATAAQLSRPSYVAVDRVGNIYLTDNNNVIRKINTAGIISTIAGSGSTNIGYSGDGGTATAALTRYPAGMSIDNVGNIYFADEDNNVIRKINTIGIISTVAGNVPGNGYSGDGGPATFAKMDGPNAVALDESNNLYISDGKNSVIRKVINIQEAGIQQFANNNEQVNIYPNPSAGSLQVTYTGNIDELKVSDMLGQTVYEAKPNTTNTTLQLDNAGIYQVSITSNQVTINKKIIITK